MNKTKKYKYILLLAFIGLSGYLFINKDISIEELKPIYTNKHSKFLEVEGMQVHYRDEGEGTPILLLHGTAASLHTWDGWTEVLKNKYRVIRMDLPGFGLTGQHPKGDYSIKGYTKFVNDFVAKLELQDFYLAGNSLGGNIAWSYAAAYPERTKRLILLDATGYPTNRESSWIFKAARTPVINTLLKYITPKWVIRKNLEQVYYQDNKVTDDLVTRYHQLSLREGNRQAFIDRANTLYRDESYKLKELQITTLILWGSDDTWVPIELGHQFDQDILNSELVIMKETGHVPMEERPVESVQKVIEFLERE